MKKLLNRVFHRIGKWFYEFGYDWWLVVGSKLYYLDVLYDTKEWVLYEHLVDGLKNGKGTHTYADGVSKYVGEYRNNVPHGKGNHIWANGNKYAGGWKEGSFHGQGTLILASGDKYVGNLKDGSLNGQGTRTYADGRVEKGIWKDGQLVKEQ